MNVELIVWKDAHSVDEWTELKDLEMAEEIVISAGVVVKESDTMVALSAGYAPDTCCCTLLISKGMIVQRQTLLKNVTA